MLTNLKNELTHKQISVKAFADFLGVSEKTAHNKLSEKTDFTYPEVKRTSQFLFPEYNLEYLFWSDYEQKNLS